MCRALRNYLHTYICAFESNGISFVAGKGKIFVTKCVVVVPSVLCYVDELRGSCMLQLALCVCVACCCSVKVEVDMKLDVQYCNETEESCLTSVDEVSACTPSSHTSVPPHPHPTHITHSTSHHFHTKYLHCVAHIEIEPSLFAGRQCHLQPVQANWVHPSGLHSGQCKR